MWLPKDERKLLKIYYWNIRQRQKKVDSKPTEERWYSISENFVKAFEAEKWKEAAKKLRNDCHKSVEATRGEATEKTISQRELEHLKKQTKQYLIGRAKVDAANAVLDERNLTKLRPHESQDRFGVSLTIDGYDLGRKYSQWHTLIGLWIGEYNWVWLIVTLLLGNIMGAVISEVVRTFL